MENYTELIKWAWLGFGFLSIRLLLHNKDKLVFESNFWGQMKKSITLILIVFSGAFGGPITFFVFLLLPRKKVCGSCGKINQKDTLICVHCGSSFQGQTDGQMEEIIQGPWRKYPEEIRAVIKEGQKRVNLPIPFVMGVVWILGGIISFNLDNAILMLVTFVVGFISGWLWWSFSVSRWREWALKQPGVTQNELQSAAELALLVWPKGHFFEKTELKNKE